MVRHPNDEPVVRAAGLAKSFGTKPVFSGVNLAIAPGTSVALIGANGTGKSTLLRCLVRLVEPSAGEITVLSQTVTHLRGTALRRLRARVGFVFQRHNLVPRLSALSNVVHGVQGREWGPRTWLHGLARGPVRDEALDCLEQVGLADLARQRADSLSGGQSQRVAIARMLMQRPELVLADEPDASLDPKAGAEIMALLEGLARRKGLSLVFVSHRLEHTVHYSDRIIGLQAGGIALDAVSRSVAPGDLREFFDAERAP